jgi:hypothetical protein
LVPLAMSAANAKLGKAKAQMVKVSNINKIFRMIVRGATST